METHTTNDDNDTVQHTLEGKTADASNADDPRHATNGIATVIERHPPNTPWRKVANRINRLRGEGYL